MSGSHHCPKQMGQAQSFASGIKPNCMTSKTNSAQRNRNYQENIENKGNFKSKSASEKQSGRYNSEKLLNESKQSEDALQKLKQSLNEDQKIQYINASIAMFFMSYLGKIQVDKHFSSYDTNLGQQLLMKSGQIKKSEGIDEILDIQKILMHGKYIIDQDLYKSQRIAQGKHAQFYSFFPTSTTIQFIQNIKSGSRLCGCQGTSKSSSAIFATEINKFITEFALNKPKICKLLLKSYDIMFPYKYIYISFQKDWKLSQIKYETIKLLQMQTSHEIDIEWPSIQTENVFLRRLTRQIAGKYKQKGIFVTLILDQFNILASYIRKALDLYEQQNKNELEIDLLSKTIQMITDYHQVYVAFNSGTFSKFIILSSINIESQLFKQYYLTIDNINFTIQQFENHSLKYLKFKEQPWHIREKLHWLFFQTIKFFKISSIENKQNLIKEYCKLFQKQFKIYGNSVTEITKNKAIFLYLVDEQPLDINLVVSKVSKEKRLEIDSMSEQNQHNYLLLLRKIKAYFPTSKQQQFWNHLLKQKGEKLMNSFYAITNLLYETQKFIDKKLLSDENYQKLKKLSKFSIKIDEQSIRGLVTEQFFEFITPNPNEPKKFIMYMNPLKCQKALKNVIRLQGKKIKKSIYSQETKKINIDNLKDQRKYYGQYLDSLFGKLIKKSKWTTILHKIYSISQYRQLSRLQITIDQVSTFTQYNRPRSNNNSQNEQKSPLKHKNNQDKQKKQIFQNPRKKMKELFESAISNKGLWISGVPSYENGGYSPNSKCFDCALACYKEEDNKNKLIIYTLDVTISTSTVQVYSQKIKNAAWLLSKIEESQKQVKKQYDIQIVHIIIGQKSIFRNIIEKDIIKQPTSGSIWKICLCGIQDWSIKIANMNLMVDFSYIKRVARYLSATIINKDSEKFISDNDKEPVSQSQNTSVQEDK